MHRQKGKSDHSCPFKEYPSAKHMATAHSDEIFKFIKSCSYPNNKAKHLAGMARMLVEDFNEIVPDNIEELQKLPELEENCKCNCICGL